LTAEHEELTRERWARLSVCEQMAHIGSEVCRSINWRHRGHEDLSRKASARALRLLDFSLASTRSSSRLREFARLREAIVDYFYGSNEFASSDILWQRYFDHFTYVARRER
jgi:hypothetical protein